MRLQLAVARGGAMLLVGGGGDVEEEEEGGELGEEDAEEEGADGDLERHWGGEFGGRRRGWVVRGPPHFTEIRWEFRKCGKRFCRAHDATPPNTMQANRFGIIGSGAIGLEHIRNICATPGAEVTMVADTTAQVRRRLRVFRCAS